MILTFGQYNVLSATRHGVTQTQLSEQTNFDLSLVSYLINGLLSCGLMKVGNDLTDEQTYYELTDIGMACIDEYERTNPDLVINRFASYH